MADKQSKFFRVAVEGDTCDGRVISRQDILDIVETYAPATYGARCNTEHYRNLSADGPFPCLGDVLAVRSADFTFQLGGKSVTKLSLEAQIAPNADGIRVTSAGQKIYSSIEINPDFANTKKAYLQGLAFTDNPASLGTQMLAFAAGAGDESPFAKRKIAPGNLFSEAREVKIELEDVPAGGGDDAKGLIKLATDFFKNFGKPTAEEPKKDEPKTPANDNDPRFAEIAQGVANLSTALTASLEAAVGKMEGTVTQLSAKIGTIETALEKVDVTKFSRTPAPGGSGRVRAEY